MPKAKKVAEESENEVAEEPKAKAKDFEYPVVEGNGKFQAVKVEGGYVVYTNLGQRATNVVTKEAADDLVLRQNVAGHYK